MALLCARPALSQPEGASTGAEARSVIYVVRRSWHVDLGFAASELSPPLDAVAAKFPGARYLFFGFGDRHYLESKHHTPPVLLRALWPGVEVILVTALPAAPAQTFAKDQVIAVQLTLSQAQAAQAFVVKSLAAVEALAPGPYEGSLYFNATPKYSAAHTCNTWVAEGLKAADLPIRSARVIFAGQLWSQVRHLQGGWVPSSHITVVPEF